MTRAGEAEWKLLTDFLLDRFGLLFDGMRRELLEARILPRVRRLHLDGLSEYYRYLLFHPDRAEELAALRVLITNNETYFFRETHQLDVLVRDVIPGLGEALRGRPLRLLSAGCSSGEEPYTIAITLQEAGLEAQGIGWEIDAFDLNPQRIVQARQGLYERASLRACDAAAKERYFVAQDDRFLLKPIFRRGVHLFEANLMEPGAGERWGPYDAIFCRNVLIYFSDLAFDRAISVFARCLSPRGYLFLGHSESLIGRRSDFEPVRLGGSIVYRKADAQ